MTVLIDTNTLNATESGDIMFGILGVPATTDINTSNVIDSPTRSEMSPDSSGQQSKSRGLYKSISHHPPPTTETRYKKLK